MRLVGVGILVAFGRNRADSIAPLAAWRSVATLACWKNIVDVRQQLPAADFVAPFTVFNIKGKKYRLITMVEYGAQIIFIEQCLTHSQYAKEKWKV
jgi:mRNA interferase HigB